MRYGYWKPYVPVAERRRKAQKKMHRLQEGGLDLQPVEIEGRKIAKTFWGIAWNDHLESFGDYANRIPRGRTYVRNGSVCHLDVTKGVVTAMVSGSDIYKVRVEIKALPLRAWSAVKKNCAGQVGSLLDLLQGKLSEEVMSVVTDQKKGLFPKPKEIEFGCNCPDVAYMCKHIAAVLYGVGARLDERPELLFKLRGVDHQELIEVDVGLASVTDKKARGSRRIADNSLADVFGIEMSAEVAPVKKKSTVRKKAAKKAVKNKNAVREKTVKKTSRKVAKKKTAKKKIPRLRNAKNELVYRGSTVAAMRKKFNMTQIEFALLVGVSTLTVKNWEGSPAELRLRKPSREALAEVEKLSKRKAWQELAEL